MPMPAFVAVSEPPWLVPSGDDDGDVEADELAVDGVVSMIGVDSVDGVGDESEVVGDEMFNKTLVSSGFVSPVLERLITNMFDTLRSFRVVTLQGNEVIVQDTPPVASRLAI